ncbi:hypothetical protein [Pseudogemmobacter bohemicus]|uniref:hypothetical protein n=1 Tax=Pseudogemmobacter bohemicus TaxID=2250708 RepID=UPI0013003E64|nr:hypothetical protein [Pseudogemmobacter bohemicus]
MKNGSDESRPAIWAEGSQKPPFEPRAFARVALKIGRETVSGILSRCGSSASEIAGEMRAGRLRIPEDRLGRTGRFLPSAASTGRAVLSGAGILRRASELAQPNAYISAPKEIDQAYRDLFRDGASSGEVQARSGRPVAKARSATARSAGAEQDSAVGGGISDELAAIRDILKNPQAEQAAGKPRLRSAAASQPESAGAMPSLSLVQRLRSGVEEGAARILGYWMIAFALPYGAIRAGLAHFNGEDLRKIRRTGE